MNEANYITNLKAALMRAWRERSSDMVWGIYLRQSLANCTIKNYSDISDVILQQALIGSNPNMLILSYLKHTVAVNVVPSTCALTSILKIDECDKQQTVSSLCHLIEHFCVNNSFKLEDDKGIVFAGVLANSISWLLNVAARFLTLVQENKQQKEYYSIPEQAFSAVSNTLHTDLFKCLFFIGQSSNKEAARNIEKDLSNIQNLMSQLPSTNVPSKLREKYSNVTSIMESISTLNSDKRVVLPVKDLPICSVINVIITLEATLNPAYSTDLLVEQLLFIAASMDINLSDVFSEVLRACMMGLVNSTHTAMDPMWAGFTFLKVPRIFVTLNNNVKNFSSHLENGFRKLLKFPSLLNLIDSRLSCDAVNLLLTEFKNHSLINDQQMEILCKLRGETIRLKLTDTQTAPSNASIIVKAASTVSSILKTIDEEYARSLDSLLSILNQMSKSFTLLLAAAAAQGNLQLFTLKLIKFNEFAKQSQGENVKSSQCRLLIFDISFLMLCSIIQLYGMEILDSVRTECADSFFIQWTDRSFPEDGQYKSLDDSSPVDSSKVESFLSQIIKGGEAKFSMQLQKWHEACSNVPFIIQEILFAWEHEAIDETTVKSVLDGLRGQMCSFSVIIAAHVCSYINVMPEEMHEKPLFILNHMTISLDDDASNPFYKERFPFMINVLKKMINDILPASRRSNTDITIPATEFPANSLYKCITEVFTTGWVTQASLNTLQATLNLCGSDWFCEKIIRILSESSVTEMAQTVGVLFALFHMDINRLTVSFVMKVLPDILLSNYCNELRNIHGNILAKLAVLTVASCHISNISQDKEASLSYSRRGRKRSISFSNLDGWQDPVKDKQMKLEETNCTPLSSDDKTNVSPHLERHSDIKESKSPLELALKELYTLFTILLRGPAVSLQLHFIINYLKAAVNCDLKVKHFILASLPLDVVREIIRRQPDAFTETEILRMIDLTSQSLSDCSSLLCMKYINTQPDKYKL